MKKLLITLVCALTLASHATVARAQVDWSSQEIDAWAAEVGADLAADGGASARAAAQAAAELGYRYTTPPVAFGKLYLRPGDITQSKRLSGPSPLQLQQAYQFSGKFNAAHFEKASAHNDASGGVASATAEVQSLISDENNGTSAVASAYHSYFVQARLRPDAEIGKIQRLQDMILPYRATINLQVDTSGETMSGNTAMSYGKATSFASVTLALNGSPILEKWMRNTFSSQDGILYGESSDNIGLDGFGFEYTDDAGHPVNRSAHTDTFSFSMAAGTALSIETSASVQARVRGGGQSGPVDALVWNTSYGGGSAYADPLITFDQAAFDQQMVALGLATFALNDVFDIVYSQGAQPVASSNQPVPEPGSLILLASGLAAFAGWRRRQ